MDRTAFDDDRLSDGYAEQDEERWVAEPPKRAGRTAFARDRARRGADQPRNFTHMVAPVRMQEQQAEQASVIIAEEHAGQRHDGS